MKSENSWENDIAIIGIACRFPGANNYLEFWNNLKNGENNIHEIPEDRKPQAPLPSGETNPSNSNPLKAGFIKQLGQFAHQFFNLTPQEAQQMDPQQYLLLEETWHCIEDSAVSIKTLQKKQCSLHLGVSPIHPDQLPEVSNNPFAMTNSTFGNYESRLLNKMLNVFELNRKRSSMDTASASSMIAIHNAKKSLLGRCDYAIAAGVHILHLKQSNKNKNLFPGEGVGVLLLERLSNAIKNKHHIYGVLKDSAVFRNFSGSQSTGHNLDKNYIAFQDALNRSNVDPKALSYIEICGKTSPFGTTKELKSISKTLAGKEKIKQFCKIGSVANNIGHLKEASGIAGVIKILLMMKYNKIPRTLNINSLSTKIDVKTSAFKLTTKQSTWSATKEKPRQAGLCFFEEDGNVHIIFEEYLKPALSKKKKGTTKAIKIKEQLFLLSAKSGKSLQRLIENWLEFIESPEFENLSLADICATLQTGREMLPYRFGVFVKEKNELKNILQHRLIDLKGSKSEIILPSFNRSLVFRFGEIKENQLEDLTRRYQQDSHFQKCFNFTREKAYRYFQDVSILNWLKPNITIPQDYWKIFSFCLTYSLAKQLLELGIEPSLVYGESYGDKTALCLCEVLTFNECFSQLSGKATTILTTSLNPPKYSIYDKLRNQILLQATSIQEEIVEEEKYFLTIGAFPDSIQGEFDLLKKAPFLSVENSLEFWFKGANISWNLYRGNKSFQKVPLPTTVFIREKLWVTNSNSIQRQLIVALGMSGPNSLFVGQIGDWTWDTVYKLCSVNPYNAVNAQGDSTYLSFFYYHIKGTPKRHLHYFGVGKEINVLSSLFRCNSESIHTVHKIRLSSDETEFREEEVTMEEVHERPDKDCLYVETFNRWISRTKKGSNEDLVKSSPEGFQDKHLPKLSKKYPPWDFYRYAIKNNTFFKETSDYKLIVDEIQTKKEYKVNPTRDLNGVGLLYFASYFSIVDHAIFEALKLFGGTNKEFSRRRITDQQICYLGNADSNTKLETKVKIWQSKLNPSELIFNVIIARQNEQKTIAICTTKLYLNPSHLTLETNELDEVNSKKMEFDLPSETELDLITATKKTQEEESDKKTTTKIDLLEKEKEQLKAHFLASAKNSPSKNPLSQKKYHHSTLNQITEILAKILSLPQKNILPSVKMSSYGLDSVSVIEFIERLTEKFKLEERNNIEFNPTTFFEFANLQKLANFLDEKLGLTDEEIPTQVVSEELPEIEEIIHQHEVISSHFIEPISSSYFSGKPLPEIAIIGVAGTFPGAANCQEFWNNIQQGKSAISKIPADRRELLQAWQESQQSEDEIFPNYGGFLKNIDKFDPSFFKISPKEAELMDPQQRILLETVWNAIEDSGYDPSAFSDRPIGLFVGASNLDYLELLIKNNRQSSSYISTGNSHSILANRISYFFNFKGPSEVIDTACSSSLVAVNRAIQAFANKECKIAIAGGVNLLLSPTLYKSYAKAGMLSKDGNCKTFDQSANGYVRGEGCGMILLKPLAQAKEDRDQIYGIIKGSAVNHGGHANTLTTPNPIAQADLIAKACNKGKILPTTLSYIEAHGTGTSLGDPIEINGLKKAFHKLATQHQIKQVPTQFCGIGSVKTNIGHLESAAGIAGLIKILFAFKNKKLPRLLHLQNQNSYIDLQNSPFYLVKETQDWPQLQIENGGETQLIPRRAGVSSFGFGGTNAHVILEEYPQNTPSLSKNESNIETPEELLLLSARNEMELQQYATQLKDFLAEKRNTIPAIKNIAFTLQVGRKSMKHRLAILAKTHQELFEKLTAYLAGEKNIEKLYSGEAKKQQELQMDGNPKEKENINQLLQIQNIQKIIPLWIQGYDVDWNFLHIENKEQRVSLPTYPFTKKRYWFPENETSTAIKSKPISSKIYSTNAVHQESPIPPLPDFSPAVKQRLEKIVKLEWLTEEIALLRMEDKEQRNMFSQDLMLGLQYQFSQLKEDPQLKVVVLTGYDNIFCMGGTKEELQKISEKKMQFTDLQFMYRGLVEFELPVISAIQGHAYGGGLIFGLYSDIVIMAEESTYTSNFTRYGFTPGMGATFLLREKFGPNLGTEMMFTAKSYTGKELKQRGASLIITKQQQVLEEALQIAQNLAEKPIQTLKVLKKGLTKKLLKTLPETVEDELQMHELTFSTDEVKQRIQNIFSKTPHTTTTKQPPLPKKTTLNSLPQKKFTPTIPSQSISTLEEKLQQIVARNLHFEEGETIDLESHFTEMGIDSISGVETIREINQEFALNLEAITIYDYPNIKKFALFLNSLLEETTSNQPATNNLEPAEETKTPLKVFLKSKKTKSIATNIPSQSLSTLEEKLQHIVARNLHFEEGETIDLETHFTEMGIDSISGVETIREINQEFALNLEAITIYDYPNIKKLALFLLEKLPSSQGIQEEKLTLPKAEKLKIRVAEKTISAKKLIAKTPAKLLTRNNPPITKPQNNPSSGKVHLRILKKNEILNPPKKPDALFQSAINATECKGILIKGIGTLEELKWEKISLTPPKPDEVQIKVKASALNFPDLLCIQGLYPTMPPYPFVPGFEISGIISKVGTSITDFKPGDEVVAVTGKLLGGHAEIVTIQRQFVFNKPKSLNFEEASSLPIAFLTAYHSLYEVGKLERGEHVLIQTAAGGVGLIAAQLAKLKGAIVYGTTSSPEKKEYLKKIGVDFVLDYTSNNFNEELRRLSKGHGIDIVLNTLAGDMIQKGIDALAPKGRYLEIAVAALKAAKKFALGNLVSNQSFHGIDLRKLLLSNTREIGQYYFSKMNELVENDLLKTVVDKVFPAQSIKEGLKYIQQRKNIGKVVLTFSPLNPNLKTNSLKNLKLKTTNNPSLYQTKNEKIEIAIIGISGRFPDAENVETFWENLRKGKSSIKEVPSNRWKIEDFYSSEPQAPNKSYSKWGGFLEGIDEFDPLFFKISPTEAEMMDPQQRLFLQECWKSLEDAGYSPTSLDTKKCGVFVGVGQGDYLQYLQEMGIPSNAQMFTGTHNAILAARISFYLNLKGPAITIDTACSSSLVSIHMACQSILSGESDLALAGGVCIFSSPHMHIMTSKMNMLSKEGQCKTFDEKADGIVLGEGVGVAVLKPLKEALKDGDQIYGIIKGSGTNQDGQTNGITAPSANSQTSLELDVYQKHKIDPTKISYIEAHGTGTKLGDPIEIRALTNSFREYTSKKQYCAIGSVKTNIGHTLYAAGIASIIKVLGSFKYQELLPSLNLQQENSHINFKDSPFCVNTKLQPWKTENKEPKTAAVSSFGFSGTNCHLVLEEFSPLNSETVASDRPYHLFTFSAKTEHSLQQKIKDFSKWIAQNQQPLELISYNLNVKRTLFDKRIAFVVSSHKELIEALKDWERISEKPFTNLETYTLQKDKNTKDTHENLTEFVKGINSKLSPSLYKEKLQTLANFFVKGNNIPWNVFYQEQKMKTISLPTYPFKKEKYWVQNSNLPIKQQSLAQPKLHPLIDENISTLEEHLFKKILTGEEFYLKDHVVQGNKVLPGVAYLEMAKAASKLAVKPLHATRITNIYWLKPITVTNRPVALYVALQPQKESLEYEVRTTNNKTNQIHSRGKIHYQPLNTTIKPEIFDFAQNLKRMPNKLASTKIYERFNSKGLSYGPTFQTLEWIQFNETECLAKLKLSKRNDQEDNEFSLHPSILDGILQSTLGLTNEKNEGVLALPFALEELKIFKAIPLECYTYVQHAQPKEKQNNFKKYNIQVIDLKGETVAQLNGFTLKTLQLNIPVGYFQPYWKPAKISAKSLSEKSISILFFGNNQQQIAELEQNPATKIIQIKTGSNFRKVNSTLYEINPEKTEEYQTLFEALQKEGNSFEKLVYAWSFENETKASNTIDSLKASIFPLFALTQALMKQRIKATQLLYLYSLDKDSAPFSEMISGFAKTLQKENPNYIFKLIGLSPTSQEAFPLATILEQEFLLQNQNDFQIRYTNEREVKQIKELTLSHLKPFQIKEKSVLLITGGLGALGFLFAKYFAQTFNAQLILLGRSQQNSKKTNQLEEIKALGGKAIYLQADSSNEKELKHAIQTGKETFGPIEGVIHSAGIIQDELFFKKSRQEFEQVLTPKVLGTLLLDELTKTEPLEFFVLFSSIASILGNIGQSDYATGNAFMDSFAPYRESLREENKRKGKSLSINWPLWKSGGMKVDQRTEKYLKETTGMVPLETNAGINSFAHILNQSSSQIVVIQGDLKKAKEALQILPIPAPQSSSPSEKTRFSEEEIIQIMMQLCSKILKVSEDEFDIETELSEYGLDSIMMMDLTNKIEERFNQTVSPNVVAEYPTIKAISQYLIKEEASYSTQENSFQENSFQENSKEEAPLFVSPTPINPQEINFSAGTGQNPTTGKIAVIGMACKFPNASNPAAYWEVLKEGKNLISELPTGRWSLEEHYDSNKASPHKSYVKWGGFLEDIASFDPAFFGIKEEDASALDPQHRILLELSQELLDNAGYQKEEVHNKNISVFIGGAESNYLKDNYKKLNENQMQHFIVNKIQNMMAARISDFYNLKGPAKTIDTACSSSLVSIHDACQSIFTGESAMAIAGGIEILLDQIPFVGFSKAKVLSDENKSYIFDERAKGIVLGEGGGLVLLKPYEKAIADRDQIFGVILGSAVNNDGHTMGLTVPNLEAQKEVIQLALERSKINPASIHYLEAHGTGTLLGDPIEIKAATQVYQSFTQQRQYCAVGSVKSNIGHLLHAAGIASFIKMILALHHKEMPPTLHCERPHPRFKFEQSPFFPITETKKWNNTSNYRAAISSFGFGGTNCHMILESNSETRSNSQIETRQSLPPTKFNRKQYWISPTNRAIIEEALVLPTKNLPESQQLSTSKVKYQEAEKNSLLFSIESYLAEKIGETLKISGKEISTEESFMDLGVDSNDLVQISKTIEEDLQTELYPTLFFEYQNIQELALFFEREHYQEFSLLLHLDSPNAQQNSAPIPSVSEQPSFLSETQHNPVHFEASQVLNNAKDSPATPFKDIAIIGFSGRFPNAQNPEELWENLAQGKNSIREIPSERWPIEGFFSSDPKEVDMSYSKWGGFLDGIDEFDSRFFKISPPEAELMDPQQRLFLQECWKSLEDAGYSPKSLANKNCGIFVGAGNNFYSKSLRHQGYPANSNMFTGNNNAILSARISYLLNLKGPSLCVDTACSSSLVAIHLACQSILSQESEMALAGGVCLYPNPEIFFLTSKMQMLSKTGQCRTFDNKSDGIALGEAVGAVVLKELQAAKRDGDSIYGVLKGSGINQDGQTNGITAPSASAQTNLERDIYQKYKINPEEISYIETHGTGTKLGDPVEIKALTNAFKQFTNKTQFCAVGSLKTNIGHSLPASGIAGLIKLLLCLKHKKLPPSLNCEQENEHIPFKETPFYVNKTLQNWNSLPGKPRLAALNSFGFSGTNAHLVLQEYVEPQKIEATKKPENLILLSAKTEKNLREYATNFLTFLEKKNTNVSLEDMAYTLQIGRAPMGNRLAMVVQNQKELRDKLKGYLANNKKIENIYYGEAQKENLQKQIEGQELNQLAKSWVNGVAINWEPFYEKETRRKVSLPTYPFTKNKYWVLQKDLLVQKASLPKKQGLHPLIDENKSTLQEQRFEKTFTGSEFYLKDHCVNQIKTLPGVAYLELARIAGKLASNSKEIRKLTDVSWRKPIQLNETDKKVVSINLYPDKDTIDFEVSSEEGENYVLHSQGKMECEGELDQKNSSPLNLDTISKRTTKQVKKEEIYQIFNQISLNYGETFQVIEWIKYNSTEALGKISLPKSLETKNEAFMLHPSILDGCLQTILGLELEKSEKDPELLKEIYLPYNIKEIILFHPTPKEAYSYVTHATNSLSGDLKQYNIQISDKQGKVSTIINGFTTKKLNPTKKRAFTATEKTSLEYYQPCWSLVTTPKQTVPPKTIPTFLVFSNNQKQIIELRKTYCELIKNEKTEFIQIQSGPSFKAHKANLFEVNQENSQDFEKLFHTLKEKKKSISKLIYLWNQEEEPFQNEKLLNNVEQWLKTRLIGLFSLTKALLHLKLAQRVQLIYFSPLHNESVSFDQMTAAFIKSVNQENPRLHFKFIGSPFQNIKSMATILVEEWENQAKNETEIKYTATGKFVKELQKITLPTELKPFVLKEKSVVLITGGLGGLGFLFAKHFAQSAKAKLILTGRSSLTAESEKKLEKLESFGGEVLYLKGDISETKEAEDIIQKGRSHFGVLNGVVHSAGIIKDSFLFKKELKEFEQVLSPKIKGTLNLDQFTQSDPLDFFVLFSSISSLFGNPGQSDYATANSFMDLFAQHRENLRNLNKRKGKTLSINWPLWEKGGMKVDSQTIQIMREKLGIIPLTTEKGIIAFEHGINLNLNQVCILEGESSELQAKLQSNFQNQHANTEVKENVILNDNEIKKIARKLQQELKQEISNLLRISPEEISVDEDLTEFGFDSVSFTDFSEQLNQKFKLELTPASFYEFNTLEKVSNYLLDTFPEKFASLSPKQSTTPEKPIISKVQEKPKIARPRFETQKSQLEFSETKNNQEEIAIIGMSGIFPGSPDLDTYWKNIESQQDLVTEIPKTRWNWEQYFGDPYLEKNKTKSKWGGFIADLDKFDPSFFKISPREAELMDPQQRLFLQTVWKTVEDAGYQTNELSDTGLFVGVGTNDYSELIDKSENIEAHCTTGLAHSILANRVSYLLDFNGPSEAIDTACSSSIVALHRAIKSIQNGECTTAIAGGVNALISPKAHIAFGKAGFLSEDGKCKSFDKSANGYSRGEGVGAILLKPLSKAIADKDHIYGVLKGSAVNHGGHSNNLTSPNPVAISKLIEKACEQAKIGVETIGYVEAHGTGSSLGDPIEINGLKKAFHQLGQKEGLVELKKGYCGIGTVKTNIGHLETASGIASVIKVLLAMKHKKLPGLVHFKELNPYIKLEDSPFYLITKNEEWKPLKDEHGNEIPRRAGVNSFGFGGANAYVLLEEAPKEFQTPPTSINEEATTKEELILLSAKNDKCLKEYARQLKRYVENEGPTTLIQDIGNTLRIGREAMDHRIAIIVSNKKELIQKLDDFLADKKESVHLFRGDKQNQKNILSGLQFLLGEAQETTDLISTLSQQWATDQKLAKLAELWTNGINLNWQQLLLGEGLNRIPLPSYPFAKERHWISYQENNQDSDNSTIIPSQKITENSQQIKHSEELSMQQYSTAKQKKQSEPKVHKVHKVDVDNIEFYEPI